MTGDASNANYSSTKSTNYPFVRLMQSYQEFWKHAYMYGILYVVIYGGVEYGPLKSHYEVEVWDQRTRQKVLKRKKAIDCISIQFPQLDREELDRLSAAVRVYGEMGIVSKQTMCTMVGFDWNKEKPLIDAENEEMQRQMQEQMQQQSQQQAQQQSDAMLAQTQASQLQGEQNIYLTKMAKDAGVPEAGPAGMATLQALSGPAPTQAPGEQPLMQSVDEQDANIVEDNIILPTRRLTHDDEHRLSRLNSSNLRTRVPD